jgi:RNA polymerase sigma-70 factor (ECF subfamily)
MSRLSQGERETFDPLFRALYPLALRFARVKLTPAHAADAAQTIMMKVFARASEFEPGKPVLPWFYAVAANELRTARRRAAVQAKRTIGENSASQVVTPDDPERALLEEELRASVVRALASLDESSAEAIACMLDDRPCPGVGAAAFRKRVSRAYAKLRLLLGGRYAG